MIPRLVAAGAGACLALVFSVAAAASPSHDLVIRPGVGIGKVRLGMSREQVLGAWGAPQAVVRTGGAIEFQYEFAAYVATLRGSRGHERVVRVATTLAKERTPEGIGVGSPEARLRSVFRGMLRCDALELMYMPRYPYPVLAANRRECTLGDPRGRHTTFVSKMRPFTFLATDWPKKARVYEVVVRAAGA